MIETCLYLVLTLRTSIVCIFQWFFLQICVFFLQICIDVVVVVEINSIRLYELSNESLCCRYDRFVESEEAGAIEQLLKAYEEGDQEASDSIVKCPLFRYMENDVSCTLHVLITLFSDDMSYFFLFLWLYLFLLFPLSICLHLSTSLSLHLSLLALALLLSHSFALFFR